MVSDSEKAIVGSINFDYRSLYHHFECGVYCYRTPCIEEIERDTERDNYMSAEEAKAYGLIDEILTHH